MACVTRVAKVTHNARQPGTLPVVFTAYRKVIHPSPVKINERDPSFLSDGPHPIDVGREVAFLGCAVIVV